VVRETGSQFLPPAPDGFFVQPADLGQQAIATIPNPLGLDRRIPAPLLFIETTQEGIDLTMALLIWVVPSLLASRTLAHANG
jgi:hypothetical protein